MNGFVVRRPVAYFIDFVIMWCVCVLPQLIAYYLFEGVPFKYFTKPYHIYFWVLLTISLPIWLYFILQESSGKQATIGKKLMKLKVTGFDKRRINIRKSLTRTFIKLLPWEITHIGLLPIYFSKDAQPGIGLFIANGLIIIFIGYFILKKGNSTIHDLVARTKVIQNV